MNVTRPQAGPTRTIKAAKMVPGAKCSNPSCCAVLQSRPARCPECGNGRLIYIEVAQ